jgi:hypothetical protein
MKYYGTRPYSKHINISHEMALQKHSMCDVDDHFSLAASEDMLLLYD